MSGWAILINNNDVVSSIDNLLAIQECMSVSTTILISLHRTGSQDRECVLCGWGGGEYKREKKILLDS